MNIAVILAGGVGSRLGAGIPKQFIEVCGRPVLAYTVEAFDKHPDIDEILVVSLGTYIDHVWDMKEKYSFTKLKWVTEGGDTFQASVMKGIDFLRDKISRDDTVLIHFGASPFVTGEIISDAIRVCGINGTNAISTTDYYLLAGVKHSTSPVSDPENHSDEYINRDTIAVMNTPHAFRYGFVDDLYREGMETGMTDKVEPHTTTLMYALGKRIFFSKGSQTNIKITTREDLEFFENYIRGKGSKV
ncbi:MAG: IspD/TarI family cytidylyltransferase [Lachnospiraceae bacterium]